MPTKKAKALAATNVPQSKDACAQDLFRLGDLQRERARLASEMNDAIAAIAATAQPRLDALQADIDALFNGIQAWCEAHRAEITNNLKVKTANLLTGEVVWRINNPSCNVRGEELVLQTLKKCGLHSYIRTSEAVNKEAVIATHMAARTITTEEAAASAEKRQVLDDWRGLSLVPGLKVTSGVETFSVTPFEQKVDA